MRLGIDRSRRAAPAGRRLVGLKRGSDERLRGRFAGRTRSSPVAPLASGRDVARRIVAEGGRGRLWDSIADALGARQRRSRALSTQSGRRHGGTRCAASGGDDALSAWAGSTSWSPAPASPGRTRRSGSIRSTPGAGVRRQPQRRLLLQPRRRAATCSTAATAASSTSPRSPARKAIRTPRPTARPRRR